MIFRVRLTRTPLQKGLYNIHNNFQTRNFRDFWENFSQGYSQPRVISPWLLSSLFIIPTWLFMRLVFASNSKKIWQILRLIMSKNDISSMWGYNIPVMKYSYDLHLLIQARYLLWIKTEFPKYFSNTSLLKNELLHWCILSIEFSLFFKRSKSNDHT